MKKKIFLFVFLGLIRLLDAQITSTENVVQSKDCLNEDCSKKIETVVYYDGLGRPKQIINVKATPAGKDLVTPVTYDGFGRKTKNILPTPIGSLNSAIHAGVTNENQANSYYGTTNAYSEKVLENSPLDRVLQQGHEGDAWKVGAGHTEKYKYEANNNGEVLKFITSTTTNTVGTVSNTISALSVYSSNSGYYPASTLYKTTVSDQDGIPVVRFENGRGQTLLIRKTDGTKNIDTYYVYDEYDNKAFVIPPKAVQEITQNNNTITQSILDELCYQYRYDGRSREVEKKIPGKGWEYTVYDKADRVIFTQDSNLRSQGNWLLSKYDPFGRATYTGLITGGSRADLQGQINTLVIAETQTATGFNKNGIMVYYTNNHFTNFQTLLSVNYYDTYPRDTPEALPTKIQDQYTAGSDDEVTTNSMQTASYVKNIEDDNWTKTYFYYDTQGREIAQKTLNHLGGYTKKEVKLDFSGAVQESYTYHKKSPNDAEVKIKERFVYDHQNRPLKHYHQINTQPEELLVENSYNEIGQLVNKKIGNTTGTPLQSVDFTYNIRGWLTKVNDPASLNGKLFAYEIKYHNPSYSNVSTGKYNGNIAEIDWVNSDDGKLRRYNYQYDSLERLKNGIYSEPNTTVPQNNYYNESLIYDVNGNILNLKRNRLLSNVGAVVMDDLSYTYSGNRLTNVVDSSGNYGGYPDSSGNLIPYDSNGNMISHIDRGILQIDYNYLNLPDYIKFDKTYNPRNLISGILGNNVNTQYLYRADGVKVKKIYTYGTGRTNSETVETTDYLDGFQYTNNVLSFVPTPEGYYDFVKNLYLYNYTDHQGNIRLAYYKDASGNLKTDRTTNYYPFGLEFGDYLGTALSISPNYKYSSQGQEKQQETGWTSYKWRNYDSAMGRFFSIDPLSEKYAYQSHYNFSENRVVDGRELEGLEWIPIPVYRAGGIAPPPPNSRRAGAGSAVYEQMKSNAINNYNGLMRGLGTQIDVLTAVGTTGLVIANRVLNNDSDKKEENKSEKGKKKSGNSEEKGVVYEVPEDGTESGVPYVGRTKKGDPSKRGGKDDGRDRKKAKVIDEYDPKNPEEGAFKEQKAIDERGGIDKLDNKRNEMNPERYNKAKAKYERKGIQ